MCIIIFQSCSTTRNSTYQAIRTNTDSIMESHAPNIRLHDIWITKRINGDTLNRMTNVPRLEINLTEMKIYGYDSCNEYHGSIEYISHTQLNFGKIASTKKMCTDMKIANKFNKAINNAAAYKLDDLNLVLLDSNGKEVLAFLKGD